MNTTIAMMALRKRAEVVAFELDTSITSGS